MARLLGQSSLTERERMLLLQSALTLEGEIIDPLPPDAKFNPLLEAISQVILDTVSLRISEESPEAAWDAFMSELSSLSNAARMRLQQQKAASIERWLDISEENPDLSDMTFSQFLAAMADTVTPDGVITGIIKEEFGLEQARERLVRTLAELERLPESPSDDFLRALNQRAGRLLELRDIERTRAEAEGLSGGDLASRLEEYMLKEGQQIAQLMPTEDELRLKKLPFSQRFEQVAREPRETPGQPLPDRQVLLQRAINRSQARFEDAELRGETPDFEGIAGEEIRAVPSQEAVTRAVQVRYSVYPPGAGPGEALSQQTIDEALRDLEAREQAAAEKLARERAGPDIGRPEIESLPDVESAMADIKASFGKEGSLYNQYVAPKQGVDLAGLPSTQKAIHETSLRFLKDLEEQSRRQAETQARLEQQSAERQRRRTARVRMLIT